MTRTEQINLIREQSADTLQTLERHLANSGDSKVAEVLRQAAVETFFFSHEVLFAILGNLHGCVASDWSLANESLADLEAAAKHLEDLAHTRRCLTRGLQTLSLLREGEQGSAAPSKTDVT